MHSVLIFLDVEVLVSPKKKKKAMQWRLPTDQLLLKMFFSYYGKQTGIWRGGGMIS